MNEIIEDAVMFCDKDIFGDEEEHEYYCRCHDGYAQCYPSRSMGSPMLRLTYPKLQDVHNDEALCWKIIKYRGLDKDFETKDVHYGDVALYMGKLTKEL